MIVIFCFEKISGFIFFIIQGVYHALCAPPNAKKKVSVLISLIFATIPLSSYAFDISGDKAFFEWNDKTEATFDELNININPKIQWNYYTITADNGKTFTVNNKTYVRSTSEDFIPSKSEIAVYTFFAEGKNSVINLHGDIDAISIENVMVPDNQPYAGVNLFYAKEGGTINIGSPGSTVKAWALGKKPDLISAKLGGKINIASTNNQFIGNIDTLDRDFGTKGSKVSGTFSGSDSYWFGDEQTFQNIKNIEITAQIPIFDSISMELKGTADIEKLLKLDYVDLIDNKIISALLKEHPEYKEKVDNIIKGILTTLGISEKAEVTESVDLIFENGAQWTYFGDRQILNDSEGNATAVFESTPKRISAITLNRGIINLYDEDIRRTWEEIGLTDKWSDVKKIDHDYVRIGDLKGNGGIFRLDLDAEDRQNSDMVFIESSSDGGQHFIEPYNMELLESVSPTNTLTFALQKAPSEDGKKFVSFAEKQNIYGQSLFDYELEIDSRVIESADQISDIKYDSWSEEQDDWKFNAGDYVHGKEWFIKRVKMIESAASIGMRSAGYASYDLAVNMDRRDRRLQNAVFQNDEKDGLWTRVQYGEAGAEHLYNADLTTVYVGYEKATSVDNRLGFSFAYTDGESDLNDLKGSGDLKRYEASVYDTLTFGSHYLDFVARFGQVDNEFDVTNQSGALTTSGSFDQKYAALSAEYGYNFKDEHNVFIEPQVQLQVAYLGDYNYRTERNMKVDADSDISVIGRVGLRTGKTFESSDYVGELYARADVLHQFTDGQDAQFSDLSDKVNVTWGNKDTWSTFGVGGYLNWKDNMSFQVDVERTAGGETIDTWLVSGRVNYLF